MASVADAALAVRVLAAGSQDITAIRKEVLFGPGHGGLEEMDERGSRRERFVKYHALHMPATAAAAPGAFGDARLYKQAASLLQEGKAAVDVNGYLTSLAYFDDLPATLDPAVCDVGALHARLWQSYQILMDSVKRLALELFPNTVAPNDQAVIWDIKYRTSNYHLRGNKKPFNNLHIDEYPDTRRNYLMEIREQAIRDWQDVWRRAQADAGASDPKPPTLRSSAVGLTRLAKRPAKMSFNVWLTLSRDDEASPLVFADPRTCDLLDADWGSSEGQHAMLKEGGEPVKFFRKPMRFGDAYVWLTWTLSGEGDLGLAAPHAGARRKVERELEFVEHRESIEFRVAVLGPPSA